MRKNISKAVAATLVLGTLAPVASAFADTQSFSDTTSLSAESQKAIADLVAKGIISGDGQGHFAPQDTLTRAQFAKIVVLALGKTVGNYTTSKYFSDVTGWAAPYVDAAKDAGFINGTSATTFDPNGLVTREDSAKMMVAALGYQADATPSLSQFSDASSIASYAAGYVSKAVSLGLVKGNSDGTFGPLASATREQAAILGDRFLSTPKSTDTAVMSVSAVDNGNLTAKVTGNVQNADSVQISVDGGAAQSVAVNSGSFSVTTATLTAGSHTVSVVAVKGTTTSAAKTASVTIATPAALAVSGVTAVDAAHIKVQFNQPMLSGNTANAADNVANYKLNGAALAAGDTATLSSDGTYATLALTTDKLVNNTANSVTVKMNVQNSNGAALSSSADYVGSLGLFNDTTAPTITSVTTAANGDLNINFSENLGSTIPTVAVDGVSITTGVTISGNVVDVAKANLPSAVTNGTTHSIIVSGAQDLASTPNTMSVYQGSFTYTLNQSAPAVTSLVAKDEKTLTLTFNKALAGVNTNGVADNSAAIGLSMINGTSAVTPTTTTTDGQTFTITLPTSGLYAAGTTSTTLAVTLNGYKDALNDFGSKYTQNVTVNEDTTAPAFGSVSYSNGNFVFSFNKGLNADSVKTALASGITITNSNGVQLASPTAAQIQSIVAGDKTVTLLNTGTGNLNLGAGTYTFQFNGGILKDTTISGNTNAAFSATVSVPNSTATPSVTSVLPTNNVNAADTIAVTFSAAVKGGAVAGSATNLSDYTLNGAALPTGSTVTLNSSQTVATITLPAGSVATSATEVLTTSNVQTLDGTAVPTDSHTVGLGDNTAPKLVSAAVDSSGNLVLTFSEDVDGMGDETPSATVHSVQPATTDFTVQVNGITVATTRANGAAENQIKLTSTAANFATGTITVTVSGTPAAKDVAGNTLTANTSVTATR